MAGQPRALPGLRVLVRQPTVALRGPETSRADDEAVHSRAAAAGEARLAPLVADGLPYITFDLSAQSVPAG